MDSTLLGEISWFVLQLPSMLCFWQSPNFRKEALGKNFVGYGTLQSTHAVPVNVCMCDCECRIKFKFDSTYLKKWNLIVSGGSAKNLSLLISLLRMCPFKFQLIGIVSLF